MVVTTAGGYESVSNASDKRKKRGSRLKDRLTVQAFEERGPEAKRREGRRSD